MPELTDESDIEYMKNCLFLDDDNQGAERRVKRVIKKCLSDSYRRIDNLIHDCKVS